MEGGRPRLHHLMHIEPHAHRPSRNRKSVHANRPRILRLHAAARISGGRALFRHRHQSAGAGSNRRDAQRERVGCRVDHERLHAQPRHRAADLRTYLRPPGPQADSGIRPRTVRRRKPCLREGVLAAGSVAGPLRPGHRRRRHRNDLRHHSRSLRRQRRARQDRQRHGHSQCRDRDRTDGRRRPAGDRSMPPRRGSVSCCWSW
ncbi:hypothetical protein ABIF68_004249 [Bradyrhizobium japonicum]